jgi:hypothetical protein
MSRISVISLLSYDYKYAFSSIQSYYGIADEIILGLDAGRLTWAGNPFKIDLEDVRKNLAALDPEGKVRIIEENFHKFSKPMENETYERNHLSAQASAGNWILQIDADEVLLNPEEFKSWLIKNDPKDHNIEARFCTVFKVFQDAALVTFPPIETIPVATKAPGEYLVARHNGLPLKMSPLKILHFSWGRTSAEVKQKLSNWGHKEDFDTKRYFEFWESVNLLNYGGCSNFHPFGDGSLWWKLAKVDMNAGLNQTIANVFEAYFRLLAAELKPDDACCCGSGRRYLDCHGDGLN